METMKKRMTIRMITIFTLKDSIEEMTSGLKEKRLRQ